MKIIYTFTVKLWKYYSLHAKKVESDNPWLVDFVIGLVKFFLRNSNKIYRKTVKSIGASWNDVCDMSKGQITSCVYWWISVKNLMTTEFCHCNKSQKIISDWICVTCCGKKIFLLFCFLQKFSSTQETICHHSVLLQLVAHHHDMLKILKQCLFAVIRAS